MQRILSIMITRYSHNYEAYNPHEFRQIRIDYYRQVVTKVIINKPTCSYKISVFIPMLTKLEISRHISLNPSPISHKSFQWEQSCSMRTAEGEE
jgi:hypothetical protein